MLNFGFLLEETPNPLPTILLVAVFGIMIFFMFRSNKKREQQERDLQSSLQVGDEIITHSGIIGKIVSIKGETFVLETTREKTKIRFLKSAVARVDVRAADLAAAVINSTTESEPVPETKKEKKGNKAKAETETTEEK